MIGLSYMCMDVLIFVLVGDLDFLGSTVNCN